MTDNQPRQPQGVPVGGQFAAAAHTESDVVLPAPQLTLSRIVEERDTVRERRERLQEQLDRIDRLYQVHSVRALAAGILAEYPNATTMKVIENADGENQFDPSYILDADGVVIENVNEDDDWIWKELLTQPGPNVQELVWDLNPRDDTWANGIGTVVSGGKWDYKAADIDLRAARNAPLPFVPEEHSPYTRSFTEDEQRDIVEVVGQGLIALDDRIDALDGQGEPARLKELEQLRNRVQPLMKVHREEV